MGGKASAKSKNKWNAENYDRINIMLPAGQKAILKDHAEKFYSGSVNAFVKQAINTQLEIDKSQE